MQVSQHNHIAKMHIPHPPHSAA